MTLYRSDCPTCGGPVVVHHNCKGTAYYVPANQPQHTALILAARKVIEVFMADAMLDDPDGCWDAAITELEAAAGLLQQEGS